MFAGVQFTIVSPEPQEIVELLTPITDAGSVAVFRRTSEAYSFVQLLPAQSEYHRKMHVLLVNLDDETEATNSLLLNVASICPEICMLGLTNGENIEAIDAAKKLGIMSFLGHPIRRQQLIQVVMMSIKSTPAFADKAECKCQGCFRRSPENLYAQANQTFCLRCWMATTLEKKSQGELVQSMASKRHLTSSQKLKIKISTKWGASR
jgi:hypothetical protein